MRLLFGYSFAGRGEGAGRFAYVKWTRLLVPPLHAKRAGFFFSADSFFERRSSRNAVLRSQERNAIAYLNKIPIKSYIYDLVFGVTRQSTIIKLSVISRQGRGTFGPRMANNVFMRRGYFRPHRDNLLHEFS